MNTKYQSIGNRIKLLRIRRAFSQLELELAINASSGTISRIENGKVNPSKETLFKICKVLNLNNEEVIYIFQLEEVFDLSDYQYTYALRK